MRKHRFFVATNLKNAQLLNLDHELSHYISRVLRLTNDDVIFLFNNTGQEFEARITNIDRNTTSVIITGVTAAQFESPLQINLAQVLAKGDKMDLIIQKATELGVHSITPLFSERTVIRKIPERAEHKLEHWQKIAIAASCQCWRNYVPQINEAESLGNWLGKITTNDRLILSPFGDAKKITEVKLPDRAVTILIGPEGGFSDEELDLCHSFGFQSISLGPRILRTETAGIATIAILQALHGDLGI